MTVARWKDAVAGGYAERACDLIVHERPVPPRLLRAIAQRQPPACGTSYANKCGCTCDACRAANRAWIVKTR